MKYKKKTLCALMLIGILGITPLCYAKTSIEAVKQETQDFLKTLSAYTIDQRDEVIRRAKESLDILDKRIDELEARVDESWGKMDTAAREKARASLKALHKQRTQLAEWYGSLKNSTGNAWVHMKKGFSDTYKDLNDAWAKSIKEFGFDK